VRTKSLLFLFFGYTLLHGSTAFAQTVNVTEYVANTSFPIHSLSTGEVIRYTPEGSGEGSSVRQYKNSNWEQFFIKGDGLYRREDTSWAPDGGAQAACENGNKVIYTLDATATCAQPGDTALTDGAKWLPSAVTVGQVYTQQTHNILPIDSGISFPGDSGYNINTKADLKVCKIAATHPSIAGIYPACGRAPQLQVTGYFEAGTYTFCSGVTNPQPLITIAGTAGAGAGDGFIYMKGCGLAGFSDANSKIGIVDGCGIDTSKIEPGTPKCSSSYTGPILQEQMSCNISGDVAVGPPITMSGYIKHASWVEYTNKLTGKVSQVEGLPVYGSVITNYSGDPCTISKQKNGNLINNSKEVSTSSDGKYTMTLQATKNIKENFIVFSCNGRVKDIYKCDLTKDTDGKIDLNVNMICSGEVKDTDQSGVRSNLHLLTSPLGLTNELQYVNRDKFSICLETPPTSRKITYASNIMVEDPHNFALDILSAKDVDDVYVDGKTNPDPNCDPANPGPGFVRCMPQDFIVEKKEEAFTGVGEFSDFGIDQHRPTANRAFGVCGNFLQYTSPRMDDERDPEDKVLPSCFWHWASKVIVNPGTIFDDKGPILDRNQLTGNNIPILFSSPLKWIEYAYKTNPETPVCTSIENGQRTEIVLGQIRTPWSDKTMFEEMGINYSGRKLDKQFFPHPCFLLAFNPVSAAAQRGLSENFEDSALIEDGDERDIKIKDDPGQRPYAAKPIIEYPAARVERLGECAEAGSGRSSVCNNSEEGGVANFLAMPDDPNSQLVESGIGTYYYKERYGDNEDRECLRVGYPVVNLCLCASKEHANAWCENPFNKIRYPGIIEDINQISYNTFSGGYSYAYNRDDLAKFYDDDVNLGDAIAGFISKIILSIFGVAKPNANYGGECLAYSWGDDQPGGCPNPAPTCGNGPCECRDTCKIPDGSGGYTQCDASLCRGGKTPPAGGICAHQLKNAPPTSYGAPSGSGCEGDITTIAEYKYGTSEPARGPMEKTYDYFSFVGNKNSCGPGMRLSVEKDKELIDETTIGPVVHFNNFQDYVCKASDFHDTTGLPRTGGRVLAPMEVIKQVGTPENPSGTTIPPNVCNAFNCFGNGVVDFTSSAECAARALNTHVMLNKGTWYVVDKYGPYCHNEVNGMPFAHNLVAFIDAYSPSSSLARKCTRRPPDKPRTGDRDMTCPAYTASEPLRNPGNPTFDYYRDALVDCGLNSDRWPEGLDAAKFKADLLAKGPQYWGTSLANAPEGQLDIVIRTAQKYRINPMLLIGIWGTESSFSVGKPACSN